MSSLLYFMVLLLTLVHHGQTSRGHFTIVPTLSVHDLTTLLSKPHLVDSISKTIESAKHSNAHHGWTVRDVKQGNGQLVKLAEDIAERTVFSRDSKMAMFHHDRPAMEVNTEHPPQVNRLRTGDPRRVNFPVNVKIAKNGNHGYVRIPLVSRPSNIVTVQRQPARECRC